VRKIAFAVVAAFVFLLGVARGADTITLRIDYEMKNSLGPCSAAVKVNCVDGFEVWIGGKFITFVDLKDKMWPKGTIFHIIYVDKPYGDREYRAKSVSYDVNGTRIVSDMGKITTVTIKPPKPRKVIPK